MMIDFSKTIRKILIEKDIAHQDFAATLGLSKQDFSRWLTRKDYRINTDVARIADALGYDVRLQFVDRETGKVIDCD